MAAGSFHPRGQGAPGEKAGELSPSREGADHSPRLGAQQSRPGEEFYRAVSCKTGPRAPVITQRASILAPFPMAVKEISLILPEETEHSAEALITDRLSHPVDYALGGVWQEVGSPLTLGEERGGRPLREKNILSALGLGIS